MSELKLDKSKWKPVTFGDVVAEVRTTTKDPVADGIQRVVGLEHIESESIHLRNWASIEGETTFTKVFRKGQVLFGRRRAYLKKAALADFDGICSGDITVMKAKSDLLPELLPFLVNNDKFFDYAVQHSAGGLSPRTKFKDLANYEFLLPPKDQQAKLAELLWAADAVIQSTIGISPKLDSLRRRILENYFSRESQYPQFALGDLVSIRSGDSPSIFDFVDETDGVPFHKVKDLNESVKYQDYAKEWVTPIEKKLIPTGSVIFPKRGASIMTNKVRITNKLCHVDTNTMALTVNEPDQLSAEFLYYFLLHKELFRIADTSQIPQINNVHINPFRIHMPPIEVQVGLLTELDAVLELGATTDSNLKAKNAVLRSLINQIF
jgi:type I restriction enzyme S subunit